MIEKIFFVFLFSLFTNCNSPKLKLSTSKDPDKLSLNELNNFGLDSLIPHDVKKFLLENFTDYKIPDTLDYFKGFCFFFNKGQSYNFIDQIPYFVTSDFNDDQLPDFAFILKHFNKLKIVILENKGKNFKYWVDNSFDEKIDKEGIKYGLYVEPPRKIDCVVDNIPQSLIMKSNGVALMKLEEMIKVYYWENGEYKIFRTK
jgi:hypothetical protein